MEFFSFPWAAVLHELLQHTSLPQGAVLQEQTAPGWFPHGVTSLDSKPAPAWAPVTPGVTGPARSWHRLPMRSQPPSGLYLLSFGVLHPPWAVGGYLLHWGPPWAAFCLTVVFTVGCRGISVVAAGALPPLLTWVSVGLSLSHILISFSY